jgi:hypothetical protein
VISLCIIILTLAACFRLFNLSFVNSALSATALTKIMDDIHLGVERSGFSISVLLDFSKTFDSMSHDLLLRKLRFKFGLSSFLGSRTQKVMFNGECSDSVIY